MGSPVYFLISDSGNGQSNMAARLGYPQALFMRAAMQALRVIRSRLWLSDAEPIPQRTGA